MGSLPMMRGPQASTETVGPLRGSYVAGVPAGGAGVPGGRLRPGELEPPGPPGSCGTVQVSIWTVGVSIRLSWAVADSVARRQVSIWDPTASRRTPRVLWP